MNNELYHHGIKGQRWGIRRTKSQLGYTESSASKNKPKKKKISEMTDDELKREIYRYTLEANYKKAKLSRTNFGRAMNFVAKVSGRAADDIGTQSATYLLGTGVNKIANDKIVNPRGRKK